MFAMAMITSCGGGQQPATDSSEAVEAVEESGDDAQMALGKQLYDTKCFACHQADGHGLPNAFPSLEGSDLLINHTKQAVAQVLNGSEKVGATGKYPAPMPPQVDTHEDAVAVINYVITHFGNNGKKITLDEVKDIEIER